MLRPPRSSTLFPYTTLFRSQVGALRRIDGLRVAHDRDFVAAVERADDMRALAQPGGAQGLHHPRPVDRKSTRLNSSHVEISYAVFCLKKKNLEITFW